MDVVDFDSSLRQSVAADPPSDLLAVHHPVWLDILRALGEDAHGLAAVDGEVRGWLLYTVTRAAGATVVSSLPYVAYGGPHGQSKEVILRRLREIAASLGADVLSVGASPLLTDEEEQRYRAALEPTHVLESAVQLQSLDTHPLQQVSPKRRDAIESEIRHAIRGGLTAVAELSEEQLEQWLAIYKKRYEEIGALPYPDAFHRELHRRAVPAGVAEMCGVVDAGGRLLGGIAFLVSPREATYFSSAFASDVRHLNPTTFLLNEALGAFVARGIETFNWHASPTPGVRAYKQRWGSREHRHLYLSALLKRDTSLFALAPAEVRRLFPQRFVLPFSAWPR